MIRFWREIAMAALVVSTAAFFGLWRYESLDHKQTIRDLKTANTTITKHKENIILTERVNNEYQTDIDRLNADIERLRKRPARCVTVTKPSGIHTGSGTGQQHGDKDGISTGWLFDYAIEAEKYRIERNHCKKFVNDVWESQK